MSELSITPLGNGAVRISDGRRMRIAYVAGPPDARWVFLDGRVYVVDVHDRSAKALRHNERVAQFFPAATKGRRHHDNALAAPMPASVVKINVEPGHRVKTGDVLIVLEAMKMELPIRAPREASVKSIRCREGELVQPGVPLLELE